MIKTNTRNKVDGITLMKTIDDGAVAAAFFDPQYRRLLDKMKYGNEGARQTKRCALPQMSDAVIIDFFRELNRIVKPSGYVFLWVDKFTLCTGIDEWIKGTSLSIVDLITWDKVRWGMGCRSRRKSEYLLILQKEPKAAGATWTDHGIPDVWTESTSTKNHPHSKPVELQKRLIEAVTQAGDLVLDPAAGSFSVLTACQECGRIFVGGDIEG